MTAAKYSTLYPFFYLLRYVYIMKIRYIYFIGNVAETCILYMTYNVHVSTTHDYNLYDLFNHASLI